MSVQVRRAGKRIGGLLINPARNADSSGRTMYRACQFIRTALVAETDFRLLHLFSGQKDVIGALVRVQGKQTM